MCTPIVRICNRMKLSINKYLSGISSNDEMRKLLSWLREKEENREKYRQEKAEWEEKTVNEEMPLHFQHNWSAIQNKILHQSEYKLTRTKNRLRYFSYAASIIVIFTLAAAGIYVHRYDQPSTPTITTVKAAPGQIANVILPDSTEIWINSDSYIQYNSNFASTNRDVKLVGEAFFSVAHNKNLPLVVSGSKVHVKVLGTRFDVAAYPDDNIFSVALERGKVELSSPDMKNFDYLLKPDHVAIYNKQTNELNIKRANINLYTSWKDGLIQIYNLPLSEVVVKLSKRYNQKFKIDPRIESLHYTFTIKNEPLAEVLNMMKTITPIDVVQKGDIIELKYKKEDREMK